MYIDIHVCLYMDTYIDIYTYTQDELTNAYAICSATKFPEACSTPGCIAREAVDGAAGSHDAAAVLVLASGCGELPIKTRIMIILEGYLVGSMYEYKRMVPWKA